MKLGKLFPVLTLGLFAVGCQDYDAGITPDVFTQKKYAETFAEKFGEIDPNQDWNMATQVVANADFGEGVNGTLKIYSKSVTAWDSEYLAHADVVDGKASVSFDVVKGTKVLHARLEKDGRVLESGYYDVIDGVMNIGNVAQTRAAGDVPTAIAYTYSTGRMPAEAIQKLIDNNCHSYSEYNEKYAENDQWGNKQTIEERHKVETLIPRLFKLNGVDYTNHDAGFTKEDLQPIFSTYTNNEGLTIDGVFKEGVDHINQYVKTGILDPDVTFWVAEEGEVELDIMWRGTQYNDFFGYYYYPENTTMTAEELWSNTNKYILIDAEGHKIEQVSSLTQRRDKNSSGEFGDWYDIDGMACANVTDWAPAETGLRGTKLKLVYYGDNPATPTSGTYTFPKGTKLGFFICHKGSEDEVSGDRFFFSDCVLNYQLRYRKHWGDEDLDTNRPFAAKFNYDGRTYVGFADESGDCDLNDLVYIIKNVNPPAADITPDDITTAKSASWHIACEDLGGTFDYDFNDVVFKVQHVGGDDYAIITPVAVGGTLETTATFCGVEMGNTHGLIGETPGTAYGAGNGTPEINKRKVVATRVSVATDFSMTKEFANFTLATGGKTHTVISGEQYGDQYKAPQVILVPGTWQWPTENTDIRVAYPKFAQWVSNAEIVDWTDPVPGKVYGEVIQRDEPVDSQKPTPTISADPTGPQRMMLYGSPLDINLSTTYGTIEGVNISTSNSNIVGISYSAPNLTLTANGVGAAKITVRVPKTATTNAGVYSFVVTVTPPDLSTYGDAIPDAKIITDTKGNVYYDKTLFNGYSEVVLTCYLTTFMNGAEEWASIYKNNQWFDAFTAPAPVWKKTDGTVVSKVDRDGIYQLTLSAANLIEMSSWEGLILGGGNTSDIVISGTAGDPMDVVDAAKTPVTLVPSNVNVQLLAVYGNSQTVSFEGSTNFDKSKVTCESKNTSIATASFNRDSGILTITAIAAGSTQVEVVQAADATYRRATAIINVSVNKKDQVFTVKIGETTIAENDIYNTVVGTSGLFITLEGTDWDKNDFSFSSSNTSVATITGNAHYNSITIVGEGETTIHVLHDETENFKAVDFTFTIKVDPAGGSGGGQQDGGDDVKDPNTTTYNSSDLSDWALPSTAFTSSSEVVVTVYTTETTYIQGVCGYNYFQFTSNGNKASYTFNLSSNPSLSDIKANGLRQNANKDKITKITVKNVPED